MRPPSRAAVVAVPLVAFAALVWADPPKKVALLVGVNQYQDAQRLPTLRYAEADVDALDALLRQSGYEVTLLTGSATTAARKPTKANIEAQLRTVLRGCKAGDTAVVAFAGHGMQFEGQTDAFFCPPETRPFADETATMVSLTKVYDELNKSFAGVKVLFVDACRNDPDQSRGARSGVTADSAPRPPQGVAALFSCKAGERAFEHTTLKHGVFFHHVLEGLRGEAADRRGVVSFGGLSDYVTEQVTNGEKGVGKLIAGVRQTPNTRGDYSGVPVLVKVAASASPKAAKPSRPATASATNSNQLDLGGGATIPLALVPTGVFTMGTDDGAARPAHEVTIANGFWIGMTEVTVGQWKRYAFDAEGDATEAEKDGKGGHGRANGSLHEQRPEFTWKTPGYAITDNHPVVHVSWNDATAFCRWLANKSGRRVTLPTEAEWEYVCSTGAARGDNQLGNHAWFAENTNFGVPRAVATRRPNGWGLYDMQGNVWEWCRDSQRRYGAGRVTDPVGSSTSVSRVLRGGSFYDAAVACRATHRNENHASNRYDNLGFRVAVAR